VRLIDRILGVEMNMIQHREAGDCEIENMICYAWHPGDTGARLGKSKHQGCWEDRLK